MQGTVADKRDEITFIRIDVNKDCIELVVVTESDVEDSLIIENLEVKKERHFKIRKRTQEAG